MCTVPTFYLLKFLRVRPEPEHHFVSFFIKLWTAIIQIENQFVGMMYPRRYSAFIVPDKLGLRMEKFRNFSLVLRDVVRNPYYYSRPF